MTVGELIKALKKFDKDAEVVVKGIVDASECDTESLSQLPIISNEIDCVSVDKDNDCVGINCQFEENPDAMQIFGSTYGNNEDYYNVVDDEYQNMRIVDDTEEEDEF